MRIMNILTFQHTHIFVYILYVFINIYITVKITNVYIVHTYTDSSLFILITLTIVLEKQTSASSLMNILTGLYLHWIRKKHVSFVHQHACPGISLSFLCRQTRSMITVIYNNVIVLV